MRRTLLLQKVLSPCLGGLMAFVLLPAGQAMPIDHSTITEVVNDVKVINPDSKNAFAAKTQAVFRTPDIMKTGADSRSEMVAEDQTITRVGANTLFSFEPKERIINLEEGSVLFQSPTGKGGGTVRTAAATASVLGTTIIVVATKDGGFKLLVLEGTGRVRMPDGKVTILHGGQLIVVAPGAKQVGPVLNFLLRDEAESSLLVMGFKRPLPSWPKIWKQMKKQDQEIAAGEFQAPTQVLGTIIDPNIRINQILGLHPDETPPPPPRVVPTPIRTTIVVVQSNGNTSSPTPSSPTNPTGGSSPTSDTFLRKR
jgi:hypothetical protein